MVLWLRHLTRRQNIWIQFHLCLSLPPWPWAYQFIFLCHRYSAGRVKIQLPTSQHCCEKKFADVREVSTLPLRSYRLTVLFVLSEYYSSNPTPYDSKQQGNYFCRLFYAIKTMKFLRHSNSLTGYTKGILWTLQLMTTNKSWKSQEVPSPYPYIYVWKIPVSFNFEHSWPIQRSIWFENPVKYSF